MAQTAALTPTSNVELVKPQARPVTPRLRVNDEPVSPQVSQNAEGGTLTPDADLELAFSPDLIPQEVRDALAGDLHIRPLASTDYARGHLDVLRELTVVVDLGTAAWTAQFHTYLSCPETYYPLVVVSRATDTIVGAGHLFVERKFVRGHGKVGHIEDIAVAAHAQGKKIGLRIIQALTGLSERAGCYKTILNCSDKNIPFYEKCGYEKRENEMAKYAAHVPPTAPPSPGPRL